MKRGTFVPRVDELDALVRRRVYQRKDGVADNRENLFDPLLLQAADEQVSSGEFGHIASWI